MVRNGEQVFCLVLATWRNDCNRVRPHSALANRMPEEFRDHHLALAATTGPGQTFDRGLYF